jgi:hypothetical protein
VKIELESLLTTVDALDGTIGVTSAGAGTTFTISLPRGQSS